MVERTWWCLKPDAVARGLIGQIITRFENVGLKVIAAKITSARRDLVEKHYPEEREELWVGSEIKLLKIMPSLR